MKSHPSLAYSLMWRGGGWPCVRDAQLVPHPQQTLERELEPGVGGGELGGTRKLRFADKLNNIEFIGQTMLQNERWEEDQTGEDTWKA